MENEQIPKKKTSCNEMRKAWFEYVKKTRTRMSRGQKEKCSHREAMKVASQGWPTEKVKVTRRLARAKKQKAKK